MENAKRFLARAVPWPTAHDNWWISIHWGWQREGRKGISFGQAFKDLDQAARWIEFLRDQKGSDMYVCMSGISVVEQRTSQKGRLLHRAQRLAQNAAALRSLWLDVDVATDLKPKGFRSTSVALEAFTRFLQAAGLPHPTFIVMSGSGGFHAHWVLEDPITASEWLPFAHALAAATRHFAFIPLDTQVVINPVCLLRIPDTFNWKTDPPKPVWMPRRGQLVSLAKISAALAPFTNINEIKIQTPLVPGQSVLGPSFEPRAPLSFDRRQAYPELSFQGTIDDVGVTCPFIAETLQTHGEGLKEPVWFESLKVAYYTRDPLDAAHRLSFGHAGYDPDETEDKLAQVEKTRHRRDLGWPQCSTIHDSGAEQCADCPHFGKGQSPLNFVVPVTKSELVPDVSNHNGNGAVVDLKVNAAVAPPSFGWLPLPYFHDKQGLVWRPGEASDENPNPPPIKVAPLPIIDLTPQRQRRDDAGEYAVHFQTQLDRTSIKRIYLPYIDFNDPRALFGRMNKQGFHLGKHYQQPFKDLMSSFTEQLFAAKLDAAPTEMLGWSTDDLDEDARPSGFVYGRMRYNCSGDRVVASPNQHIDQNFYPRGSIDRWKAPSKLIFEQKNPALNALVACSLGAPLVAATGHTGIVINGYGVSGISKSTACRVGHSMWANPAMMAGTQATTNAIENRVSTSGSLPMYFDDWRDTREQSTFINLIFGMTQGRGKLRLDRSSQPKPINTFRTLLIMTTNDALSEHIIEHTKMTEAGIYRLFEFEVTKNTTGAGMINIADGANRDRTLDGNYGVAGKIYAEFLGKNASKVFKEVHALYRSLVTKLNGTQSERFWIAAITVIYMGAHYGNQLGITEIDLADLFKFLIDRLQSMRGELRKGAQDFSKSSVVLDQVANYINDRPQQTVMTELLWDQPGNPGASYDAKPIGNFQNLRGRLAIRAAKTDKKLRLSVLDFSEWARRKGYQPRALVKSILNLQLAKEVKGTITARTGLRVGKTSQEKLLQFDLAQLPFLFNFDE
jgi:Domain of unknown function (DUF927)